MLTILACSGIVTNMMTLDEVARHAVALANVTEGERYANRTWFVGGKAFVWERPFSKADIKRFGAEPVPGGSIIAVAVADINEKEAILAENTKGVFTISHFDGYAAVLVQLDVVSKRVARELITDAWLALAPRKVADEYLTNTRPATQKR
jgi:hypothetical protein